MIKNHYILKEMDLTLLPSNVEDFVNKTTVLPTKDKATEVRIDFIFSLTPYEQKAIKRAKDIFIKNKIVKFASLEDAIIHKIFAGRPRDLEDVKSMFFKNPSIDLPYIRKWLAEFDKSLSEKGLLKKFNEILNSILPQKKTKSQSKEFI
ncbi:MAG: DUF6036 family nucleotidyltransferase [Candidatus Aerophobetes bacterium]|nr:DUF6036 family nucleotidyltransferase [Candidatus Aerophobetes bacterium]